MAPIWFCGLLLLLVAYILCIVPVSVIVLRLISSHRTCHRAPHRDWSWSLGNSRASHSGRGEAGGWRLPRPDRRLPAKRLHRRVCHCWCSRPARGCLRGFLMEFHFFLMEYLYSLATTFSPSCARKPVFIQRFQQPGLPAKWAAFELVGEDDTADVPLIVGLANPNPPVQLHRVVKSW